MADGVGVVWETRRELIDPDGRWERAELSHCATDELVGERVRLVDAA
jgi:hypothetical protein